jgi:hypothetical protein
MLDRDKFAIAFARFLGVPLLEEEDMVSGSVGGVGGSGRSRSTVVGGGSAGEWSRLFVSIGLVMMTHPSRKYSYYLFHLDAISSYEEDSDTITDTHSYTIFCPFGGTLHCQIRTRTSSFLR